MAPKIMVGCRVPADWKDEIQQRSSHSGRTPSEFIYNAIAVALNKKSTERTVEQRLTEVEQLLQGLSEV